MVEHCWQNQLLWGLPPLDLSIAKGAKCLGVTSRLVLVVYAFRIALGVSQ